MVNLYLRSVARTQRNVYFIQASSPAHSRKPDFQKELVLIHVFPDLNYRFKEESLLENIKPKNYKEN